MKQTCPDCKTIVEIDEREYPANSQCETECPLCGATLTFDIPATKPKIIVKNVTRDVDEEQNNKIARLEEEIRELKKMHYDSFGARTVLMPLDESDDQDGVSDPLMSIDGDYVQDSEMMVNDKHVQYSEESVMEPNDMVPKLGWNWGAFLLGWIWGAGNGIYWPMVSIIVYFIPNVWLKAFIILVINIILGNNGSNISWAKKNWGSARRFNEVQHNWSKAGFIAIPFLLINYIIIFVL